MANRATVRLADGQVCGFVRYADALRWAQDDTTGPCTITWADTGRLLSERRADGVWYNAAGEALPSPRVRKEV